MEDIITSNKKKMQEALSLVQTDFNTIRTGKANAGLVENIMVNAYGGTAKLKVLELATIHVQDPQTIVITPFDHSVLNEIQNSITNSQANLAPVVDGDIIRITIPPLTEERRRDFVKMVNQKAEQGKVLVRQVRHKSMEEVKKHDEAGGVSEDEVTRVEKEIQRETDAFIEKIDNLRTDKEEELMKI